MIEIKFVKTRRSNAVVSKVLYDTSEEKTKVYDDSDHNWRTNSCVCYNLDEIFFFMRQRDYRWVLQEDGDKKNYIPISEYERTLRDTKDENV